MNPLKQLNDSQAHWAMDGVPDVLTQIYKDDITIAIWQRSLSENIDDYVQALLQSAQKPTLKVVATPSKLLQELQRIFPESITINNNTATNHEFLENINELLEMFSCLFDAETLGLRINTLERSMCPRFHVDHVPVRLVTTYGGAGTEWLPAAYADCSKLGRQAGGVVDENSGIICNAEAIQQLRTGDVALLKGENWEGNEGRGLIHRSPNCHLDDTGHVQRRLLITCDLV